MSGGQQDGVTPRSTPIPTRVLSLNQDRESGGGPILSRRAALVDHITIGGSQNHWWIYDKVLISLANRRHAFRGTAIASSTPATSLATAKNRQHA